MSSIVDKKVLKSIQSIAKVFKHWMEIVSLAVAVFSAVGVLSSLGSQYFQYVVIPFTGILILVAVLITRQIVLSKVNDRDVKIATAFSKLEEASVTFEIEATRLFFSLAAFKGGMIGTSSLDLTVLMTLHETFLKKICDTAVEVLTARAPGHGPFRANIKQIFVTEDTDGSLTRKVYKPLVRSENYDQRRRDHDDGLEEAPHELDTNYVYRKVFDDRFRDDFFIHDDIDELLHEITSKERAREPNKDSANFYKSFMVFPIYGNINGVNHEPTRALYRSHSDKLLKYKGKSVFGLMCVDSATTNSFNRDYDPCVMRQLTMYALWSFRMVLAIRVLAAGKKVLVHRQDTKRIPL
jgi:hypothetical protein